jgi:phospholipase C
MRESSAVRFPLIAALVAAACTVGAVPASAQAPTTPIERLVVIYNENVSFDHYFATYPNALNPSGDPAFTAKAGTPAVNGLSGTLLTNNPNSANPYRIARSMSATCDNGHSYTAEQQAFHGGLMDQFVEYTSCGGTDTAMGYFDGNTVTAMWNYAQQYGLSDNFFGTVFGPSLPGHLNLISGNTHGATPEVAGAVVNGTVIGGPQPKFDQCGANRGTGATDITFGSAENIGTKLSAKGVTWGYFQGGFRATGSDPSGAICASQHTNIAGGVVRDYIPHHEPFQYYDATRNPTHKAPASPSDIGHDDPPGAVEKVNHQYDVSDFDTALSTGNVPAVSFIKPPGYQDGHAGYSNPLDEQRFLVETINKIQASPIWDSTAIVIAYDDSDGWYDHQASPIHNSSHTPGQDQLNGPGDCHGSGPDPGTANGYELRCGYGPRLPLLVVSPFARQNHVDHAEVDQTSILRFIEDNWNTGRIGDFSFDDIPIGKASIVSMFDFTPGAARAPKLVLDPATGNPPAKPDPPPVTPDPPPVTPDPKARKAALGFSASVKPKRDRRKPYVFALKGKLRPPAGALCRGRVRVTVKTGRKTVGTKRTSVKSACGWKMKLRYKNKRRLGKGRLVVRARYLGSVDILPRSAKSLKIRAG